MKTLKQLEFTGELKAGDILLFPAPVRGGLSWLNRLGLRLVCFLQSFISHPHGHYGTTHAAICLRNEAMYALDKRAGNPIVAHVTNHAGYQDCALSNLGDLASGPYWIYRPKDDLVAQRLSELANRGCDPGSPFHQVKWSLWSAMKAYFASSKNKNMPSAAIAIESSTICSTFVAESVNRVAQSLAKEKNDPVYLYQYKLPRHCMPKALEAELYNNNHYDLLCYTGCQDPYELVQKEILSQLTRLEKKKSRLAVEKHHKSLECFKLVTAELEEQILLSPLDKALFLVKAMQPYLSHHTSIAWRQARSFAKVSEVLFSVGVFKRDIEQAKLPGYLTEIVSKITPLV